MKLITAIVQPDRVDSVKEALFNADVHKMTVTRVSGCGQQKGFTESYRGQVHSVNLLEKVKFEIAVNQEFVDATIDAIIEGAFTDSIGDGKIWVTNIEECVRIRTKEKGQNAIG